MKRLLFSSDLHGNLYQYETLVRTAVSNDVTEIIIGGDLNFKRKELYFNRPEDFDFRKKSPETSLLYFEKYIFPILEDYVESSEKHKIYLSFGNADYSSNLDRLNEIHPQLVFAEEGIFSLTENLDMLIYGRTCLSPHKLKDNERFEWMNKIEDFENTEEFEKYFLNGYTSFSEDLIEKYGCFEVTKEEENEKQITHVDVIRRKSPEYFSIEFELGKLLQKQLITAEKKKKNIIWICHSPPYKCNDTIIRYGTENEIVNIGSRCIRKFIEDYKPTAVFSGHVHESYFPTGKYVEEVGETLCFCSGNSPSADMLHSILIEFDEKEDVLNYNFLEDFYMYE